jgi:uncharacterized protein
MAGMVSLTAWAAGDESMQKKPDDLEKIAPEVIAPWIVTLNAWRLANYVPPKDTGPVRRAKVGRNDPCPCGSGKKYKRCCGAH